MGLGLLQAKELSEFPQRGGRSEKTGNVAKFDSGSRGDARHPVTLLAHPGSLGQLHQSGHEEIEEEHVVVAGPAATYIYKYIETLCVCVCVCMCACAYP